MSHRPWLSDWFFILICLNFPATFFFWLIYYLSFLNTLPSLCFQRVMKKMEISLSITTWSSPPTGWPGNVWVMEYQAIHLYTSISIPALGDREQAVGLSYIIHFSPSLSHRPSPNQHAAAHLEFQTQHDPNATDSSLPLWSQDSTLSKIHSSQFSLLYLNLTIQTQVSFLKFIHLFLVSLLCQNVSNPKNKP